MVIKVTYVLYPFLVLMLEQDLWDNNLTAETNMAKLGLRQSANRNVRPIAAQAAVKASPGGRATQSCEVARLFGNWSQNATRLRDFRDVNVDGDRWYFVLLQLRPVYASVLDFRLLIVHLCRRRRLFCRGSVVPHAALLRVGLLLSTMKCGKRSVEPVCERRVYTCLVIVRR